MNDQTSFVYLLVIPFFDFGIKMLMQKHKGLSDPLEVVAQEIAHDAILLCLDEFMVSSSSYIYHLLETDHLWFNPFFIKACVSVTTGN